MSPKDWRSRTGSTERVPRFTRRPAPLKPGRNEAFSSPGDLHAPNIRYALRPIAPRSGDLLPFLIGPRVPVFVVGSVHQPLPILH